MFCVRRQSIQPRMTRITRMGDEKAQAGVAVLAAASTGPNDQALGTNASTRIRHPLRQMPYKIRILKVLVHSVQNPRHPCDRWLNIFCRGSRAGCNPRVSQATRLRRGFGVASTPATTALQHPRHPWLIPHKKNTTFSLNRLDKPAQLFLTDMT
jgi:hypothetical protein